MSKLWEKGEATVKEIIATYPEPRPSRTSISTFVKFLVEKGILGHEPAESITDVESSPLLLEINL